MVFLCERGEGPGVHVADDDAALGVQRDLRPDLAAQRQHHAAARDGSQRLHAVGVGVERRAVLWHAGIGGGHGDSLGRGFLLIRGRGLGRGRFGRFRRDLFDALEGQARVAGIPRLGGRGLHGLADDLRGLRRRRGEREGADQRQDQRRADISFHKYILLIDPCVGGDGADVFSPYYPFCFYFTMEAHQLSSFRNNSGVTNPWRMGTFWAKNA